MNSLIDLSEMEGFGIVRELGPNLIVVEGDHVVGRIEVSSDCQVTVVLESWDRDRSYTEPLAREVCSRGSSTETLAELWLNYLSAIACLDKQGALSRECCPKTWPDKRLVNGLRAPNFNDLAFLGCFNSLVCILDVVETRHRTLKSLTAVIDQVRSIATSDMQAEQKLANLDVIEDQLDDDLSDDESEEYDLAISLVAAAQHIFRNSDSKSHGAWQRDCIATLYRVIANELANAETAQDLEIVSSDYGKSFANSLTDAAGS